MTAVWKYNWAPDVGPQNKVYTPERPFIRPGEPGLFICTWPKSKHWHKDGVRYQNEVWTGIEYQVAANMIYDGLVTEGLSVIRAVHLRYDGAKHNPWNEVECGDHYARSMSAWGCVLALQGLSLRRPNGLIGFAPQLQARQLYEAFSPPPRAGATWSRNAVATPSSRGSRSAGAMCPSRPSSRDCRKARPSSRPS